MIDFNSTSSISGQITALVDAGLQQTRLAQSPRQYLGARNQAKVAVARQECGDDGLVLLLEQAAGAIDEAAAGFHEARGGVEDGLAEFSATMQYRSQLAFDILRSHPILRYGR